MINLDAGDILYAVAASTGIRCSVFGDFRSGQIGQTVTDSFKPLFKGNLATGSPAALVTISNAQQALIKTMEFNNTNASSVVVTLYLSQTSVASRTFTIPANGSVGYEDSYGWTVYDSAGVAIGTVFALPAQANNTVLGNISGGFASPVAVAIGDVLTAGIQAPNAQTGTAYTFALGDQNTGVTMNNAAANTATVPPNSAVAFPIGTIILIEQIGAGQTTIAAGAGVTINNASSLTARAQYSVLALWKTGTNTWTLFGDMT